MLNIIQFKEMLEGLEGIQNHKEYIFYYDETNNYKKVKITGTGLNVNEAFYKNYVLGGFCCLKVNEKEVQTSISELFSKKLIKYLNGEIKAHNLFKDCQSFIECLNRPQINVILNWINTNGFIHYSTMNCFYYTIINIVDSFFTDEPEKMIPKIYSDIIKSQLYHIINAYFKNEFIKLANLINYPNVEGENIEILCDWLIKVIDSVNGREDFELELFRQIIKSKRKSSKLLFLQDNEEKIIADNFFALRQQKCIIFDNSFHVFDEESTDEGLMIKNPMTKDGKTTFINYTFQDSKKHRLIQISDVIVSLIAKFFDYIDNNAVESIAHDTENLNKLQKSNLLLLINLINQSYKEDKYLISAVNSMDFNISRNNIMEYIQNLLNNK